MSDFGGSIVRPIIWLLLLLFLIWPIAYLFGLTPEGRELHLAWGANFDPEFWNAFGLASRMSFRSAHLAKPGKSFSMP